MCGRLAVEIKRLQEERATLSIDGDSLRDEDEDVSEGLMIGGTVQVK